MRGALGLIAIAVIVWAFWMTWEHLRKASIKRKNKEE